MHYGLSRLGLRVQFAPVWGRRIQRCLPLVERREKRPQKYVLLDHQANSDGICAHDPQARACSSSLVFWRTSRDESTMQPLPFTGVKRLRDAKKIIDRIGNQLIAERKSALLREQSSGIKEKSDTTARDLLTLLVRANLRETDGMSDSDIRARKVSHALPAPPHNRCFF